MTEEELARAKTTPEYKALKTKLANPEWRIDNLYWIQDQHGNECLFKRNAMQRRYWASRHLRNVIPKARQLGMSTEIGLEMLDTAMFRSNTRCGIVDARMDDARKKLARIKFAYKKLPAEIRRARPLTTDAADTVAFANGSIITVGTTYRGDTAQFLHISEYGKISVDRPDQAKEIKTGAIRAVHASGRVDIESTAHGTTGEFYDYVQNARKLADVGTPLTALDFKLHFYPWWLHPEYRLPNNLVLIDVQMREYFDELQHKHGVKLDADQRAWYAKMHQELGPDDMLSEYPSTLDEAFFNSLKGTYYKSEINRARREGRIGGIVPHDPTRRVNTTWDIGEDCTVIWFHQTDGLRHRWIDYWEMEGSSLQEAAGVLEEKRQKRGFLYAKHYAPHDFDDREWGHRAETRREVAKRDLGLDFIVVPRVERKADSIDALRRMINMSWIDEEHCKRGVQGFESYRKKWNKALGMFEPEPVHDWSSHIADSAQQIALALRQEKEERSGAGDRHRRGGRSSGGSAWSE